MLEKGMDDSNKLMSDSQDCLSIRFPFGSFFGIKGVEERVYTYDSNGHEEEDAAKAFVTTFRDMATAFPLSGLIDSGVKAGIGDEFLPGGEGTVVGFGQEVRDSGLIKSWDGAEDSELVWELGLARMDKASCYLFEFLLQAVEETDFGAENSFKVLRGEADRGLGQLAEELWRETGLTSSSGVGQDIEDSLRGGLKNSLFGRESSQETKGGIGKGVNEAEYLGEKEVEVAFDLIFSGDDLSRDILAFPGQGAKFISSWQGLRQGLDIGPKELGNGRGISFIGLSLSQGELGEIIDKDGVKETDIKVMSLKEGAEGKVVRARRLEAELNGRRCWGQIVEEIAEALGGHGEGTGPEELALVIHQGSLKAILGDIEAAEIDSHWFTSSNIIKAEAGEASRPILHSDKGSWTQSTYQDNGRQRTDSFEGSRAQVEWSSPASSLLSYSLDKLINNFNY